MRSIFGDRIYALDALRGLSALSVVFWHWQHFFIEDDGKFTLSADKQPFFECFSILYGYGANAVQLFFVISGFIFFYLYSDKIKSKNITAKSFIVNRVSRLCPLYIISSLIVAAFQGIYIQAHQEFFVYQMNDWYHAILNLFMVQAWGFQKGWSFNAPTWSISIEVLMYAAFFMLCKFTSKLTIVSLSIVLLSYIFYDANHMIMKGSFSFFVGGLSFILTRKMINKLGPRKFFWIALFFH